MAIDQGLAGAAYQYFHLAVTTHPGSLPGASWALWWFNWTEALVYPAGAAALTLLLIPSGHLPSRRWRPVVAAAVPLTLLMGALYAVIPEPLTGPNNELPGLANPMGLPALRGVTDAGIQNIAFLVGVGILLVAAAAPLVRMRRAHGDE